MVHDNIRIANMCVHTRPVARNFNWVVLLYKIVDLFNKIVDILVVFSSKIVDLLGKIVNLLFERGFFHT